MSRAQSPLLGAVCPCGWSGGMADLIQRAGHGPRGSDVLVCPRCQDTRFYHCALFRALALERQAATASETWDARE